MSGYEATRFEGVRGGKRTGVDDLQPIGVTAKVIHRLLPCAGGHLFVGRCRSIETAPASFDTFTVRSSRPLRIVE